MELPNFNRLIQLKNKIISLIVNHRILILVSVVSISLVVFSVWAIKVRNNFIARMKSTKNVLSNKVDYSATPSSSSLNIDNLTSSDSSVLGVSDNNSSTNVEYNNTFPTPTSYPIITLVPLPTFTPQSTTTTYSTPTSTPSCAGKPTSDNSQVYVSSSSTQVNNAVTISVELRDCNNNFASVNDDLKISLLNSDSSARINGSSSPVTIKAQNGKAAFSVNSQNTTTDTFVITDTSNSFDVTMPGYHNPSVTFTNGNSGNPNCTTGAGVPNSWYSDVYPVSPVSAVVGSTVTFTVEIRDCNKNETSITDTLSISLSSGDPSTQVSGNNFPFSVTTQNGHASFTITSSNAGNNTFIVQDTTNSFPVTDTNNHNPSVTFNGSSTSTPTDTPTPTSASTDTPTSAPITAPTDSPTPLPTPSDITPSSGI